MQKKQLNSTMMNTNLNRVRIAIFALMLVGVMAGLMGGWSATAQSSNGFQVAVSINPTQVSARGTGSPDATTVSLSLTAPAMTGGPADVVLVLDHSKSVDLELVKNSAHDFVDHLSATDNVAVVSFADSARVVQALTADRAAIRNAINGITQGSHTAMGDGLMMAIDEMVRGKRATASQIIVAATDGVNNLGQDPLQQASRAAQQNIPIYPVGMSPAARHQLLSQIASETGGMYFANYSDSALARIFRGFGRSSVASNIRVSLTLPSGVNYEGYLFQEPAVNKGREVTQLEWIIYQLFEGGTWQSQFRISALRTGSAAILQAPSEIQYHNASGQTVFINLLDSGFTIPSLQGGQGTGTPPPSNSGNQGTGTPPPPNNQGTGGQSPSSSTNAAPVAALAFNAGSPTAFVIGEAVVFNASGSTDSDGQITKLEWDWTNDGTIDLTTDNPATLVRHPYGRAGEFTARVIVTDNAGATAEATLTVAVIDGLRAGAALTTNDFRNNPTTPEWMAYYIDDSVVTDEEVRDANARFAADVFIPGTQYRLTSEDVQAIIQVNDVAKLVAQYSTTQAAEAAGYVKIGNFINGIGQMYVKEAFLMGPVIYNQPPVLLYDNSGEGGALVITGVRYISKTQTQTLFQITGWPNHAASAHYADGTEQAAASVDNVPTENATGSPLLFWHPTLYGLTAWVTSINPDGLFASRNPQVNQ